MSTPAPPPAGSPPHPPPPPPPLPVAPASVAPEPLGSIEALKRVKEAETEWELRLRVARGQVDAALDALRSESENAVKAAQVLADGERTNAVLVARQSAEREAAEILAMGTKAAEVAARGEGKSPAEKKDAILSAVLAGFL